MECMTLDSLAEEIGPSRLMFMDTEGEEPNILRGGSKYIYTHRPRMVLEASPQLLRRSGSSITELYGILAGADYCVYEITRIGVRKLELQQTYNRANWLCLPREQAELSKVVEHSIRRVAFMPCIGGLNPLTQAGVCDFQPFSAPACFAGRFR